MSKVVELNTLSLINGGHCIAHHNGKTIFVRHALPKEKLLAKITETNNKFWRADTIKILEPSPHRIPHIWEEADSLLHENIPGGAEFGHITFTTQQQIKTQIVTELFTKIANIKLPKNFQVQTVAKDTKTLGLHWRTRMKYAINKSGQLGMFAHRDTKIVPIKTMPLASKQICALDLAKYNWQGFSQIQIFFPHKNENPLLLVTAAEKKISTNKIKQLLPKLPNNISIASYTKNFSNKTTLTPITGKTWVYEQTLNQKWRITGNGFWQIHYAAAETLTKAATELAQLETGTKIWDLFAGVGLFGGHFAKIVGEKGKILSVESSKNSSKDAKHNLKKIPQIQVVNGKVNEILAKTYFTAETIFLDPPRCGIGEKTVKQITLKCPKKIIYLSCDPATLARDINYFQQYGWNLTNILAYDIYPHTHHVECIALLTPQKTSFL